MSQRSLAQELAYRFTRFAARIGYVLLFHVRCHGRQNYPPDGGALVCSNHQSHLDAVLLGLSCDRRLNYLARQSLFKAPLFGALIRFYDAIPLDRDGRGIGGIKESLQRIRRGEMLLLFPEGTRTRDGNVAPLKAGFCPLARRGGVPIVPVGIDGAFDAWPRSARLPRQATIHLCVGPMITADCIRQMTDEQLIAEVERRIRKCHADARRGRRHSEAITRPGR